MKTGIQRAQADFAEIAGEPVRVERIGVAVFAFGSELAALRLYAKYNTNGAYPNSKFSVGYSENLKEWYFSIGK